MVDLTNPFPSHGSSGEKPPSGLNKSGGDQYEAEFFDFYSDQYNKNTEEKNAAIKRRVEDLSGDVLLDGCDVTNGSAGREVDVSSSSGAYVGGQFTGSISATTITLAMNGSGSTRTDVLYVDESGNVQQKSGQTTVPSGTYKLAEVDINTSDAVVGVRDYGRTVSHGGVANERPNGGVGDTLLHEGGAPSTTDDSFEVHDSDSWEPLLFADGRQQWTDDHDADGNGLINVGNITDDSGSTFTDKFLNTNEDDTTHGDITLATEGDQNKSQELYFDGGGVDGARLFSENKMFQFVDDNDNTWFEMDMDVGQPIFYGITTVENDLSVSGSLNRNGYTVYDEGNFTPSDKSDVDHDHSNDSLGVNSPISSIHTDDLSVTNVADATATDSQQLGGHDAAAFPRNTAGIPANFGNSGDTSGNNNNIYIQFPNDIPQGNIIAFRLESHGTLNTAARMGGADNYHFSIRGLWGWGDEVFGNGEVIHSHNATITDIYADSNDNFNVDFDATYNLVDNQGSAYIDLWPERRWIPTGGD